MLSCKVFVKLHDFGNSEVRPLAQLDLEKRHLQVRTSTLGACIKFPGSRV